EETTMTIKLITAAILATTVGTGAFAEAGNSGNAASASDQPPALGNMEATDAPTATDGAQIGSQAAIDTAPSYTSVIAELESDQNADWATEFSGLDPAAEIQV